MKKYFLLLFAILLIGSVLAVSADWPFTKDQTCNFFNLSNGACELFWCQSIKEGTYNVTQEFCQFVVNNTIIQNVTIGTETNVTNATLENYYNKTDVYNKTETNSLVDNKTASLRDSVADNYVLKGETTSSESNGSGGINPTYIIIGIIVFAALVYFVTSKSQSINPAHRGQAPTEGRKLQSKPDMEYSEWQDQRLSKVQRELAEIEELKKEKSRLEKELFEQEKAKKLKEEGGSH